jgi:ABC-type bacteriocin/lantibiotic exporter with double-glycine peptidase domain
MPASDGGVVSMRLVRQKGEDGCGIACVAMVASTDYKKAKRKLPDDWESKGTTKKQMLKWLRRCEISTCKPKHIAGKRYKEFKFDAVLHGYLGDEKHWTVWDSKRKKLLDPYRTQEGRQLTFKCTSFIRVEPRI